MHVNTFTFKHHSNSNAFDSCESFTCCGQSQEGYCSSDGEATMNIHCKECRAFLQHHVYSVKLLSQRHLSEE